MRQIRDSLEQDDIKVWTDEHLDLDTAQWQKEIEYAILHSSCLVVLLSPSAKDSDWVGREISYAQEHNRQIIPVLISGDAKTAVPLALISHQRLTFHQLAYTSALEKLTDSISGVLGRETPSMIRKREEEKRVNDLATTIVRLEKDREEQEKRIQAEAERRARDILQKERENSAQRTEKTRRFTAPILKLLRQLIFVPISPFVFYTAPFRFREQDHPRTVAVVTLVLIFGSLSFLYAEDAIFVSAGRTVQDILGFTPGQTEVGFVFIFIPFVVLLWYSFSTVYSLAATTETKEAVTASFAISFGCAIGAGVAYALQQYSLSFLSKVTSGLVAGILIFGAAYVVSYYFTFIYVLGVKKKMDYHRYVHLRSLLNVLILIGLIVLAVWLFGMDGWIHIVNV